jgi:hypothetical protein
MAAEAETVMKDRVGIHNELKSVQELVARVQRSRDNGEITRLLKEINARADAAKILRRLYGRRPILARARRHNDQAAHAVIYLAAAIRLAKLKTETMLSTAEVAAAEQDLIMTSCLYDELESRERSHSIAASDRRQIEAILATVVVPESDTVLGFLDEIEILRRTVAVQAGRVRLGANEWRNRHGQAKFALKRQ